MVNPELLKYLVLSLFSGWGGGDLGLHNSGFFTPWAVDFDRHARRCFSLNARHTRVEGFDLFKVRIEFIMQHFGLTKGIQFLLLACPCQGLSAGGKRDVYDKRNILFLRSLRLFIPALLPKVFVLENVSGLNNKDMAIFYNLLQDEFELLEREYIIKTEILNTLHYNVPQDRERYIAIGVHRSLGIQPSLPEPNLSDEGKRICDICPDIEGIRYGYGKKKFKHKFDFCNTVTKTPNLWVQRQGEVEDLTIKELFKFCGYPSTWLHEGSYNQIWNRTGNSIMPPFMQAIGEHIYTNILQKAGVPLQNIEPYLNKANEVVTKTEPAKKPVRIKKKAK